MSRPRTFGNSGVMQRCSRKMQAGLTLVELMVSITLGLLVVMVATALLLSSKSGYTMQDEATRLQETGRYAIESIARTVRQAAYENLDKDDAPIVATAGISANIVGFDASSLNATSAGIGSPLNTPINGSDVLAIRFFGSGTSTDADGTIVNCAGFGVPSPTGQNTADADRGWSIFYLAESKGEPELRCKYLGQPDSAGNKNWVSDAIVRGVESFQVLYGIDTDNDSLPNRFLTATAINALDDALVLVGADVVAKALDKNKKTHWKKVVVVKIALLVRGEQSTRADTLTTQYDLFGADYSGAIDGTDVGTRIKESTLPAAVKNRIRKIFTITIQLRNQAAGSQA